MSQVLTTSPKMTSQMLRRYHCRSIYNTYSSIHQTRFTWNKWGHTHRI